jgi:ABC-2 type transport system permease protein
MTTASLLWFARHELKLAWRDWAQMAAGGRTKRERSVLIGAVVFVALLHLLAYALLSRILPGADLESKATLITLTASILLTFSTMLSHAIEQVTRAFYARADLDLILSSPASSRNLFAVRIASIALAGAAMSAVMMAPAINAAAWIGGVRWLSAYAVIAGLSAFATGLSVLITLGLFRVAGVKRTRLIAQIIAAVVGAALLIGLQAAAVFAYGRLSRFSVLNSEAVSRAAPAVDSLFWMPARALVGDASAAVIIVASGIAFLALVIAVYAAEFGTNAIVAASTETDQKSRDGIARPFRKATPVGALRYKRAHSARPRSVASFANPDADPLLVAARSPSLEGYGPGYAAPHYSGACTGDGVRAALRRAFMAYDLWRGRARSRGDGASITRHDHPR